MSRSHDKANTCHAPASPSYVPTVTNFRLDGSLKSQCTKSGLRWSQLFVSYADTIVKSDLLFLRGRFYATSSDHIKELNHVRPKQPFFFLKPPSSILPHGAGPILKPKGVNLHYEVELALVMGKTLRDFDSDDEQGGLSAIKGMES